MKFECKLEKFKEGKEVIIHGLVKVFKDFKHDLNYSQWWLSLYIAQVTVSEGLLIT